MTDSPTSSDRKRGIFITFEGTEGGGKSTQIQRLEQRLRAHGRTVRALREPGGTPIGEEIRHTLKHSENNGAMTPEAELLLLNASRAQLVREVIRPALEAGEVVLCDRFLDSTVAYQGYGRGLDLLLVNSVIEFAVGRTRPHLTLWLSVPVEVSERRRAERSEGAATVRDRFEQESRDFFSKVEAGFRSQAALEPARIRLVDASQGVDEVEDSIWSLVGPLFPC